MRKHILRQPNGRKHMRSWPPPSRLSKNRIELKTITYSDEKLAGPNDSMDDFVETTDTEANIEANMCSKQCLREGIDSECLLGDTDQVFLFTTEEELDDTPNVDSEPVRLHHDLAPWTVLSSSPLHAANFDLACKQKGEKRSIKTSKPHLLAEVRDAPMGTFGDFSHFKKVQDRLVQHVDVGLRRKRQAPERMSANTWGVALDDKKRKRTKLDANVRQSKKNTLVTYLSDTLTLCHSDIVPVSPRPRG